MALPHDDSDSICVEELSDAERWGLIFTVSPSWRPCLMARIFPFFFHSNQKNTMAHSPKTPFVQEIRQQGSQGTMYAPLDNLSGLDELIEACFWLVGIVPSLSVDSANLFCIQSMCIKDPASQSSGSGDRRGDIVLFGNLSLHGCCCSTTLKDCHWRAKADFWPAYPIVAPLPFHCHKCICRMIHL